MVPFNHPTTLPFFAADKSVTVVPLGTEAVVNTTDVAVSGICELKSYPVSNKASSASV